MNKLAPLLLMQLFMTACGDNWEYNYDGETLKIVNPDNKSIMLQTGMTERDHKITINNITKNLITDDPIMAVTITNKGQKNETCDTIGLFGTLNKYPVDNSLLDHNM